MGDMENVFTLAYDKAVREAENLEDAAKRVEQQRKKLMESKAELFRSWKGENADEYKKKVMEREEELEKLSRDVKEIAKAVKDIADLSNNAEKKAAELVKQKVQST